MSLVILLILSEDDVWCNQINQIQVKHDFKFYSDKQSGLFSLGMWLTYNTYLSEMFWNSIGHIVSP